MPCNPGGDPGPRREPQLLEDLVYMVFDGMLGDRKLLRDLGVGEPPPDEERDFLLTGGKTFRSFVCRWRMLRYGGKVGNSCFSTSERAYSMARSGTIARPSAQSACHAASASRARAALT